MHIHVSMSIQCSYCHRNESIEDAADSSNFCLEHKPEGGFQLRRNHAYYFQVCIILCICSVLFIMPIVLISYIIIIVQVQCQL